MKVKTLLFASGLAVLLLGACSSTPLISVQPDSVHNDPVRADPKTFDAEFPPTVVELDFKSHGHRLNGHIYLANGSGPHPTVLLLHGYPGNEKNLDLAQAMRRDGFNVLFFHYRGAWGSEGQFSYPNIIEDVASAVAMLRARQQQLRVDSQRLLIIGHSLGGFAALHGAAQDPTIKCVAGIAAADIGARAELFKKNPEAAKGSIVYGDNLQMLAGWSGQQAIDQIVQHSEAFKLGDLAEKLRGKSVLLLAGDQDTAVPIALSHAPMVAAYSVTPGIRLTDKILSGDHSFSWSRLLLIDETLDWAQDCK